MSENKKPNSKETNLKLEGHNYDGIEELDNSLPSWWINGFYLTIIFSVAYFAYYTLWGGPSLIQEYQQNKQRAELEAHSQAKPQQAALTEEDLRAFVKNPEKLKVGKEVFQAKCISCHGKNAEGGIGPNLTDDYWIHGGKLTEIINVITKGVAEKGMPPWGPILKPEEIQSVAAYIKSLRGTNPPNAKAPQGDLVKE